MSAKPTEKTNLVISVKATAGASPETQRALKRTEGFTKQAVLAGNVVLAPEEVFYLKKQGVLPENFKGPELTTALKLFSKGAKSENLFELAEKSGFLSDGEREFLFTSSYIMASLEASQAKLSGLLYAAAQESQIFIQEVPTQFIPQDNQIILERKEGVLQPLIRELTGRAAGIAKDKTKKLVVSAIKKGGKKLIKEGSKIAAKAGLKAAEEIGVNVLAQAAGSVVPVLGNIAAAVVTFVVTTVLSGTISWFKKHKGEALVATLMALGILTQTPLFFAGGLALGAVLLLAAIILPSLLRLLVFIAVILLSLGLLVALIIFIINSGAYVVPPSPFLTPYSQENQYIEIEKTPNPEGPLTNPPPSRSVNYTITITAKQSTLTNISFSYECRVVGSGSSNACPSSSPAIPDPPSLISPTQAFTFSYNVTYDSRYADSIVVDTLTVTADVPEQMGSVAAGSASVVIGNPPIDCPLVSYDTKAKKWASYTPGNETQGHGSNAYWNDNPPACHYSIPQSIGCLGPTSPTASSNVCYGQSSKCAQYGYAYDVWPVGSMEVFAPRVGKNSVTWNCSYAFANGAGAAGHTYRCNSGAYSLVLTHMSNGATTGTISSGQKFGELFPMNNAHLHMEFSINGVYQRPEDFFCF
jgi:hypothetical protein